MSYQDRGGSVERARSDHAIKAAEAEQQAALRRGTDEGLGRSRGVLERLRGLLRR